MKNTTDAHDTWINKASCIARPEKAKFLLHQYNNGTNSNELRVLNEFELFDCPDYKDFYYQVEPYHNLPRGKKFDTHFGINVSNEGSNSFDYGIYTNQVVNLFISTCSTPAELIKSINMNLSFHSAALRTISALNHDDFDRELSTFFTTCPFWEEIDNLNAVRNASGFYILVLDDYACCYIGQSKDIKKRIQQHWAKVNFGTTGIDMFKALDTTRIYVVCTDNAFNKDEIDHIEYKLIHSIDRKYLLNCLGGGSSIESIHSDSPILGYGCDPV